MLLCVERVCKQKIKTPGYEHSLIGPNQILRGVPPSPTEMSPNLLTGPGRNCKIVGKQFVHPTVSRILQAHSMTAGLSIARVGVYRVLFQWMTPPTKIVPLSDAVTLKRMIDCRTHAELEAVWTRPDVGILVPSEPGNDLKPDLVRLEHFFMNFCIAKVPADSNLPIRCGCKLFRSYGECAH
eukprot:12094989-Karenia_brevis.AAC.1